MNALSTDTAISRQKGKEDDGEEETMMVVTVIKMMIKTKKNRMSIIMETKSKEFKARTVQRMFFFKIQDNTKKFRKSKYNKESKTYKQQQQDEEKKKKKKKKAPTKAETKGEKQRKRKKKTARRQSVHAISVGWGRAVAGEGAMCARD